MKEENTFEGWAILELMGHRKLAGKLSEAVIGGASFIRIDLYYIESVEPEMTQFYSPQAVYGITPMAEALARRFAEGNQPVPVSQYELPRPEPMEAPPPFPGEEDED